jgi:hypothetical protein
MTNYLRASAASLALVVAALGGIQASAANVDFQLSNVKFDDGTSLTGGFTIDDATGNLVSFDINSEAGTLPGFEYTTGMPTYRDLFYGNEYIFVNPAYTQYVSLTFAAPLTTGSNALITTDYKSYECDNCTVVRSVVSGSAVSGAVPEPASWALMLGGFGAIGGAMRSRRKAAVSFG